MKNTITIYMVAVSFCMHAQKACSQSTYLNSGSDPTLQWIMIHKDGMLGYMDNNGVVLVPPIYESIGTFDAVKKGLAVIESTAGLKGLINAAGTVILEPKYNFIENADEYNEDWLKVELDGYTGFIDKDGNEVVAPVYDEAEPPRKTISAVRVKMSTIK